MGKNKSLFFFDTVIVLLNLAAGRGNILLYWLTGFERIAPIQFIVILLDLLYIAVRAGKIKSTVIRRLPLSALFILIILFVNLLNIVLEGKVNPLAQSLHFFVFALFAFILYKISNDYLSTFRNNANASRFLSRGYVWLSLFSIVGVFLSFFLMNIFGLDPSPVNADFMAANMDKGYIYYRSYFTVNMFTLIPRVPFFQKYGMLSGLFHEVHLFAMNVFPCLILMLGFAKTTVSRWLIIISSILVILFAGSATNILVVGACLVVYFVINSKKKFIGSIIGAAAIALAVMVYVSIDDTLLEFLLGRLDEGSGSQQYSVSLLEWTFTPRTLMGSDFFSTDYVEDMQTSSIILKDVGYIPFLLNIVFIFLYLKDTIKLLFSKVKVGTAVGFASLYLILHSGKIGMTLFAQTLPLFIVFIQTITINYLWKKRSC